MREDYHYCPRCGGRLEIRVQDGRDRQVCSECGYVFYQNPAPAVGVIIVENNEVLLVQRKFEPRKGGWTLPAGFVEYDEFVEDCAVRELKEETNLDVELTGLFGAYSAMDDPRVRVVLLLYTGKRTGGELRAGDDAIDAGFFPIDELPEPIAFRAHVQALADVKKRLIPPS
ncbi:MAG: NUDIX hydrolase [Candidatus Latescibacterota bacterium]|jgi:ADP-ribose pyrophosphatase YjhB (NUDIX family)